MNKQNLLERLYIALDEPLKNNAFNYTANVESALTIIEKINKPVKIEFEENLWICSIDNFVEKHSDFVCAIIELAIDFFFAQSLL